MSFDPLSLLGTGVSAALGVTGLASNQRANEINQQNFEKQMNFAKYQYEDTKKWNSPANQVRLLRAAGLNPALAFGQSAVSQQSSVSQPSPNPQTPLDLSGLSSMAHQITSADVERDKTNSEIRLNHLKAISDDWSNFIHQSFDVENATMDLKIKEQNLDNIVKEGVLLAAKGDSERALEKLRHAEEFAAYAAGGLDEQRRNNFEQEFKWFTTRLYAVIDELNSRSEYNRAAAGLAGSQRQLNSLEYAIRSSPEQVQAAKDKIVQEWKLLKRQSKLTDKQIDHVEELIRRADMENDYWLYMVAYDYLLKTIGTAGDIALFKSRVQALGNLADAARQNSATRARKQDYVENTFEDEVYYERDKTGKPKATKAKRTVRRHR